MPNEDQLACWDDPANWSAWGIYRCEDDPRLIVPKQTRWAGWTVNFAQPGAVSLLVAISAIAGLPSLIAALVGVEDPLAMLAVVTASGVAVVALVVALDRHARGLPLRPTLPRRGRLPHTLREELQREGIMLLAEKVRGSITLRDYRGPGKRSAFSRNGFSGAIVLTQQRFIVRNTFRSLVELPIDEARSDLLDLCADGSDTLLIRFDPSRFQANTGGAVEIRLRTSLARSIVDSLRSPHR